MARKIRRNDPCPCGSGRKYKHCCLGNEPRAARYTADERSSALDKLYEVFADLSEHDPEFQDLRADLTEEFWGPLLNDLYELGREDVVESSFEAFVNWVLYDVMLDGEMRALELILERAAPLDLGEQRWLDQQLAQTPRLYEVTDVVRGSSLTLRDLLDGTEVTVSEIIGSQTITRWDLLAARVMPIGASGQPEMDGALLSYPRQYRDALIDELKHRLAELRREYPGASEAEHLQHFAPLLHWMWLSLWIEPPVPELQTTTGETMLVTKVRFDVIDAASLIRALDGCASLDREPDESTWRWLMEESEGQGMPGQTILGTFTLEHGQLIVETLARERGEKARTMVEDLAGAAVRYTLTSYEDPMQRVGDRVRAAIKEGDGAGAQPPDGMTDTDELTDEEVDELLRFIEAHYQRWLDDSIPALDDTTPRAAARSRRLLPRLVNLLQDLENTYLRALSTGQPAYDPSWLWSELGLEDHPDAPPRWGQRPPRLGHQSVERLLPGLGEVAREVANTYRAASDGALDMVVTQQQLADNLACQRFLREVASTARRDGAAHGNAAHHGELAAAHLAYLCNHELHNRKTFWVDGGLAWQLTHTTLDLTGDLLRLPFASCAFVFTDRHVLGLGERAMAADPSCHLRGRMIRVTTVYLSQVPVGDGSRLKLSFVLDTLDDEWPWLLEHELLVGADTRIDTILDSYLPDASPERLAPVRSTAATRRLFNVVIGAVLYATSSGAEQEVWAPRTAATPAEEQLLCSDEVFSLPGRIEISQLRQLQAVERAPSGRKLLRRFMVRGHWRRANPSWKDQRPRWIRPHWKGPDIAVIIEREYEIRE